MIILFKPSLMQTILFFQISPGSKFNRKEIKEKTQMNNIILDNTLIELINLKILKKEKNLYSINLQNEIIQYINKETKEIFDLPLKIKFILIDSINGLQKIKNLESIILFGSYAKLIYHKDSDIDLAIISKKDFSTKEKRKISLSLSKISKKHKKEIQEHFFSINDLKQKKDPLIKDILRNGKKLI